MKLQLGQPFGYGFRRICHALVTVHSSSVSHELEALLEPAKGIERY